MVAIRLEDFRLRTGLSESVLPTALAVSKLASATALAQRLSDRVFGHAIELVEADGSDAIITAYRHGLPASGKVFLSGLSTAGLTGAVSYTRVDTDSIRVADVTVAATVEGEGMLAIPVTKDVELLEQMVRLGPGPIAGVEELRVIGSNWEDEGEFGSAQIVDPSLYYVVTDGTHCWSGEVEVSSRVQTYTSKRRPGMINAIRVNQRRKVRAKFFAGCVEWIPDDILEAIGAIAQQLVSDPLGEHNSESYDYYSYSRLSADEIRKMPTSAVATLLRYKPMM
jgi:hypothetical protein